MVPLIMLGGSIVRDEERTNDFADHTQEFYSSNK